MVGNIAWKFHGRVSVTVHGPLNPTNLEWQQFLRDAVRSGTGTHWRNLVVSYGGRPDGEQRKQLGEMLRGRGAPTAILTASPVVRAAVSAISFFNRSLKAFAFNDLDGAAAYLELTADEREKARELRHELVEQLGLSQRAAAS